MSVDNHSPRLSTPVVNARVASTTCNLAEIGARMRVAREALGLTQKGFCEQYGYQVRTLQKNEAGLNEAGICLSGAFIRAGINANWLLTGEGPMLLAELAPKPAEPTINRLALQAIIAGLGSAGIPPAKLGAAAFRAYDDAITQGLITHTGIGDGGVKAA